MDDAAGRAIGRPVVAEDAWRRWLGRSGIGARRFEAELGAGRRVVVVAPHPDDEWLGCGGLLARQARLGGEILVVAVTDGEASHPGDPAWPSARLGAARREESRRGLAHLPYDEPPRVDRLGLPDGAVAAHGAALRQALRTTIRPADLVLTCWRHDGHPDHDATGAATAEVVAGVGGTLVEAPVWMWHWARLDDPRVPWPRLRSFALDATERATKAAGLAEHATQFAPQAGSRPPVLDGPILARAARPIECFFVAA